MNENVKMSVKGTKLTIEIDLAAEGRLSDTNKTFVLASTHGNVPVPGMEELKVGVNLFRANPNYVAPPKQAKAA